ncbi:MAG: thiosulfohydrolase SoxB [Alphaproteobacteria bacterium]
MTISRRDFMNAWLGLAATGSGLAGGLAGGLGANILGHGTAFAARQGLSFDDILAFKPMGQVSLLHFTDIHAQLMPIHYREPEINLGVGEVKGLPPHITGADFLKKYNLEAQSAQAHALAYPDFVSLAKSYGKIGGIDRMASLVDAIRAERADNCLLLDGGDTWQGSYTSLQTGGEDMVAVMNAMGLDAMTGHWEFTYGTERVGELIDKLNFPFLAGNVRDTEWEEPVYEAIRYFDRGGVRVAVIGQAFPYTPVANPRYLIPELSFGIREETVQASVDEARGAGAQLVVLLSHNGFDVDRKLAGRVQGLDVVLTGHTHDALPEVVKVGKTLLVASGSHGKFLSRLDLDVGAEGIRDFRYKLMPIFSDVIPQQKEMKNLVESIRAPHKSVIDETLGHTDDFLYRRGNFNGTFDDLICNAMLEMRDADIALSPGFRWGSSLLPGQAITGDDVYNLTAITYPNCYRTQMTGEMLKIILEDVADNLFNLDPYYQQGGDMVRVGGMGYTINPMNAMGSRISNMVMLKTGKPIEADKNYQVAGWASVNEGTEGPPIYDLVSDYIKQQKTVKVPANDAVKLVGI